MNMRVVVSFTRLLTGLLTGLSTGFLLGVVPTLAGCRIEVGQQRVDHTGDHTAESQANNTQDTAIKGKVVLYTSAYREVADALVELAHQKHPNLQVDVFQGGSEKIATRLDAEIAAGRAGADVLLTSDPIYYEHLKHKDLLLSYVSPNATPIPRPLVDYDNTYTGTRISSMVLAYNPKKVADTQAPHSFQDLIKPAYCQNVAFGDPLASGTFLMTVLTLWAHPEDTQTQPPLLPELSKCGASLGGGNSVVLSKIVSGEKLYGALLLENVLTAQAKGEPIAYIVPEDGAVLIAGAVAGMKSTQNLAAAKALIDLILSPEGQAIIANTGQMHAANPLVAPPKHEPAIPVLTDWLAKSQLIAPEKRDFAVQNRAALQEKIQKAIVGQ